MSDALDAPVFLTGEWRDLAMLNYEVAPADLRPLLPAGVEPDQWRGRTFISLVGFRFLRTVVLGVAVPFHRDFEEVNLRFYVRRRYGSAWRRGVVFIRELVPRAAIALTAKVLYNEPYTSLPMRHSVRADSDGTPRGVDYEWRIRGEWQGLRADADGNGALPEPGSLDEFITEHYWGYCAQRDGGTLEYRVEHPRWHVWRAQGEVGGDLARLYGPQLAEVLTAGPSSAFIADGSQVRVGRPVRLTVTAGGHRLSPAQAAVCSAS